MRLVLLTLAFAGVAAGVRLNQLRGPVSAAESKIDSAVGALDSRNEKEQYCAGA